MIESHLQEIEPIAANYLLDHLHQLANDLLSYIDERVNPNASIEAPADLRNSHE
jgi:hypothetical protein